MIYLKEFETESDYNIAKDDLLTPNVSLITNSGEVKYLKGTTPVEHEYVDLGLPSGTLWAKCNVGAETETDYGNYYQYGKGADEYSVTSGDSIYIGAENPLALTADTANQVWGDGWHMPTEAQCEELYMYADYEYTTINGVNGTKFTHKEDSSKYIFLPSAGSLRNGEIFTDEEGSYWTSTPQFQTVKEAMWFDLYDGYYPEVVNNQRDFGYSIRPVKDAE